MPAILGLKWRPFSAWGLNLSDLALLAAIQRALHQVAFLSGVQLERVAKFLGETLGRVGNAAETALHLLSKLALTPPDTGQHCILEFFSLHLGVFDLLQVDNLEPFADSTNVAVDYFRDSLVGTTDLAPVGVDVPRLGRLPAHALLMEEAEAANNLALPGASSVICHDAAHLKKICAREYISVQ